MRREYGKDSITTEICLSICRVIQFSALASVVFLPPPMMGEGWGGGGERSRSPDGLLPPIPAFPHAGGKGPKSPVRPAKYRELNGPGLYATPFHHHARAGHGCVMLALSQGCDALVETSRTWHLSTRHQRETSMVEADVRKPYAHLC
jgi:hypothetical protein